MAKKEYPEVKGDFKPKPGSGANLGPKDTGLAGKISDKVSEKVSGFSAKMFAYFKFLLGICLLQR